MNILLEIKISSFLNTILKRNKGKTFPDLQLSIGVTYENNNDFHPKINVQELLINISNALQSEIKEFNQCVFFTNKNNHEIDIQICFNQFSQQVLCKLKCN